MLVPGAGAATLGDFGTAALVAGVGAGVVRAVGLEAGRLVLGLDELTGAACWVEEGLVGLVPCPGQRPQDCRQYGPALIKLASHLPNLACCSQGMKGGPGGTLLHEPEELLLRQRPQLIWQYPPAGAPLPNMKPAPHLPKSRCWLQEKGEPGGGVSLHEEEEAGGALAAEGCGEGVVGGEGPAEGQCPQVALQKPPLSMKSALHLPNAFCCWQV